MTGWINDLAKQSESPTAEKETFQYGCKLPLEENNPNLETF
ncbi:hypothetical protein Rhal01_02616 [Rubritalea halochordaticola]|uniref:Uncharacterized protein n=1 Tax=Rubritalea halochordaticola TaxID=714537 RepID=A0ABP9V178_9BACT